MARSKKRGKSDFAEETEEVALDGVGSVAMDEAREERPPSAMTLLKVRCEKKNFAQRRKRIVKPLFRLPFFTARVDRRDLFILPATCGD